MLRQEFVIAEEASAVTMHACFPTDIPTFNGINVSRLSRGIVSFWVKPESVTEEDSLVRVWDHEQSCDTGNNVIASCLEGRQVLSICHGVPAGYNVSLVLQRKD